MSVSNNWKWAHVHSVWVSGKWNTFAEGQWSVVRYRIWKSAVFRTNTTVISADSPPRVASTMQPKPTRAPLGPKVECLSSGPGVNMDVGLLIRTVEEPLLKPLWTTRELKVIHFHPTCTCRSASSAHGSPPTGRSLRLACSALKLMMCSLRFGPEVIHATWILLLWHNRYR